MFRDFGCIERYKLFDDHVSRRKALIKHNKNLKLPFLFAIPKNQSIEVGVLGFAINKTAAVSSSVTNHTTRSSPAAITAVEGPISG